MELTINNSIYSLVSVIEHSGTIDQGHYRNYSKRNNIWYLFNDNIFNPVSEE